MALNFQLILAAYCYYIFVAREHGKLTNCPKVRLIRIQQIYKPIERDEHIFSMQEEKVNEIILLKPNTKHFTFMIGLC